VDQPVDVTVRESGGECVVEIRDHGPGIPVREQAQVFEKFYRGMSTGRHVAGSGMGLSIAREIIELHGGRAWIESRPGNGVSFFAAIPLAGPADAKKIKPEPVGVTETIKDSETVKEDREVA
jgi:signal transduction histidine kinase